MFRRLREAFTPDLTDNDTLAEMERSTRREEEAAGIVAEVLRGHRVRNHVSERLAAAYREAERR